jgi:hypothetical protein
MECWRRCPAHEAIRDLRGEDESCTRQHEKACAPVAGHYRDISRGHPTLRRRSAQCTDNRRTRDAKLRIIWGRKRFVSVIDRKVHWRGVGKLKGRQASRKASNVAPTCAHDHADVRSAAALRSGEGRHSDTSRIAVEQRIAGRRSKKLDSGFRRNDEQRTFPVLRSPFSLLPSPSSTLHPSLSPLPSPPLTSSAPTAH